MTEDEAKQKWCPHAMQGLELLHPDGTVTMMVANRWDGGTSKCLASGCMAWRWGEGRLNQEEIAEMRAGGAMSMQDISRWIRNSTASQTDGYCGLAGKP